MTETCTRSCDCNTQYVLIYTSFEHKSTEVLARIVYFRYLCLFRLKACRSQAVKCRRDSATKPFTITMSASTTVTSNIRRRYIPFESRRCTVSSFSSTSDFIFGGELCEFILEGLLLTVPSSFSQSISMRQFAMTMVKMLLK